MRNLSESERPPFIFSTVDSAKASIDDIDDKVVIEALVRPLEFSRGFRNVGIVLDRLGSEATLEEIAGYYGITKERVRQIVNDGLEIIRADWGRNFLQSGFRTIKRNEEIKAEEASFRAIPTPRVKRVI